LTGNKLAGQARGQLLRFLRAIDLPVSLKELGLADTCVRELEKICDLTCKKGSDLRHLPFQVSSTALLKALCSEGDFEYSSNSFIDMKHEKLS